MIINVVVIKSHVLVEDILNVIIIGMIMVISTSNTRNNVATRKNWIENGIRGDLLGSNPHSNGDIFSRSMILFFLVKMQIIIISTEMVKVMKDVVKIIIIILSN